MKFELFKNMIKEEVRLNTSLHSKNNFFAFPLALLIMTLGVTVLFLKFSDATLNIQSVALYSTIIFFIMGISSGTFGLNASDYLERRFGDVGKLFGNALILPIKLSNIFLMSAASDSVFYVGWLVLPVWLGFSIGLVITGASITMLPLLLLALFHAFVLGILTSFFFTILFVRSKLIFTFLFGASIITLLILHTSWNLFPSYLLFTTLSWLTVGIALLTIIVLVFLCIITVGKEYKTTIRKVSVQESYSSKIIKDPFVLKDYIDLRRTHGIIAKPLFSTLIPSLLLLAALTSLNHLPTEFNMIAKTPIFFAIIIGVLNVSFFNMLLQGDSMAYYIFLPVTLHQYIRSKVTLASIVCLIEGTLLLVGYTLLNPNPINYLPQSILILIGFIIYSMSTSFFVTGLHPNENALNATNFIKFALFMIPFLIVGMLLPFFFENIIWYYLGISILLVVLSAVLYSFGIKHWSKNLSA